jgi:hypothetical protein
VTVNYGPTRDRARRRVDEARDAQGKGRGTVILIVLVVAVVVLAGIGVALSMTPPEVTQPLVFNHSLHIEEVGLECADCHLYVTSGERTVVPNIQGCADCHIDEPMTDSEAEVQLLEYVESGQPIPWRQIHFLPDHVYFSHRRHTTTAEIACETCHGPVGERTEPLTRPLVPIDMDTCVDCHYSSGASNDCISCHR